MAGWRIFGGAGEEGGLRDYPGRASASHASISMHPAPCSRRPSIWRWLLSKRLRNVFHPVWIMFFDVRGRNVLVDVGTL